MTIPKRSDFSPHPSTAAAYAPRPDVPQLIAPAAQPRICDGHVNDVVRYRTVDGPVAQAMVIPPPVNDGGSLLHLVLDGSVSTTGSDAGGTPLAAGQAELRTCKPREGAILLHQSAQCRVLSLVIPKDYVAQLFQSRCTSSADCTCPLAQPEAAVRRFPLSPDMLSVVNQLDTLPFCEEVRPLFVAGKYSELLALALNTLYNAPETCSLAATDVARLNRARLLLERNLSEPPSLLRLAHQVGINDFKLKKGFRELFQTTPYAYLRKCRMLEARRILVQSDRSVTDIANAVGYSNLGHFAAAFRKQFGVTPRDFRKTVSRQTRVA